MYQIGYQENGRPKYSMSAKFSETPVFAVPCGKCILCRQSRANRWRDRLLMHFASFPDSVFITLTYNNSHLPKQIEKSHIQKFLKRLRITLDRLGVDISELKYFIASEFGTHTNRLHYHGILFSLPFRIFEPYVVSSSFDERGKPHPLYSSKLLEKLWQNGFISLAPCSPQTISYIIKYITKDDSVKLYSRRLGCKEFLSGDKQHVKLSRFGKDTFKTNKLFLKNKISCAPRFLERYMKIDNEEEYYQIKDARRALLKKLPFNISRVKDLSTLVTRNKSNQQKKEKL